MSRKTVALGIVCVVIIGLSLAYYFTDGFMFSSIQLKINQLSSTGRYTYSGQVYQQVWNHNYEFEYIPTFTANGTVYKGSLTVQRTDLKTSTSFPLTINFSQNYQGITFTITQANSEYAIVLVKPTLFL
jgi:hypothetical protein